MAEGDDGEEANKGEVGDTLMNQFHTQSRLERSAALENGSPFTGRGAEYSTVHWIERLICMHGKHNRKIVFIYVAMGHKVFNPTVQLFDV